MLKEQGYNLHANDILFKIICFFFKVWKGYRGKLEEILPGMLFKAERENKEEY